MLGGIGALIHLGAVPATIIIVAIIAGHYSHKLTKTVLFERNRRLETELKYKTAEQVNQSSGTYFSGQEGVYLYSPLLPSSQSPAAPNPQNGVQLSSNMISFNDICGKNTKTNEK